MKTLLFCSAVILALAFANTTALAQSQQFTKIVIKVVSSTGSAVEGGTVKINQKGYIRTCTINEFNECEIPDAPEGKTVFIVEIPATKEAAREVFQIEITKYRTFTVTVKPK
ncbi:MAG: hypothetical protein JNK33_03215 [Candidatus Doudnabacteria bacterium]|nr:hypothetical protein [Candidatus Doudnabacteria bacterium]